MSLTLPGHENVGLNEIFLSFISKKGINDLRKRLTCGMNLVLPVYMRDLARKSPFETGGLIELAEQP